MAQNAGKYPGSTKGPASLSNQDHEILPYLVRRHCLNLSQALAARQVLDESCITTLIGGARTRKSETLVACIKAVLWQQGYIVAQNPDPTNLSTINQDRRVGGPEGDSPPPQSCVLVTAPTNA